MARAGDGTTKVDLEHTGIPDYDAHGNGDQKLSAERGWRERIFLAINKVHLCTASVTRERCGPDEGGRRGGGWRSTRESPDDL